VNEHIENTRKVLNLTLDKAFLVFTHSLFTDNSIHTFSDADDVDGGQDKQIDAITNVEENDEAYVYITQPKNVNSYSSNQII
jgi:hypothetical protein